MIYVKVEIGTPFNNNKVTIQLLYKSSLFFNLDIIFIK